MRVHAHHYGKVERGDIVDGAILMHQEMSAMLRTKGVLCDHDVLSGPSCLAGVRDGDVVYAGCGPYAFLYFLWRKELGVDFRILREVHTAFWSGYWTQEELCAEMVRPGDLTLFPTEYARRLYDWTPYARAGGTTVVYPLLDGLVRRSPRPVRKGGVRIGYLGALSAAKNFDQVLAIFARVHRADPKAKLVVAGKPNNSDFAPDPLKTRVASCGIGGDAFAYQGIIGRGDLPAFFEGIDVLLFPSTASRETLGRVVLEALAHGVPVLAARIGPAVELLPPDNLLPTRLRTDLPFTMARGVALGEVDVDATARTILSGDYGPAHILDPAPYRDARFWECVTGATGVTDTTEAAFDRTIVDSVEVAHRARPAGSADAEDAARLFFSYFRGERHDIARRIEHAVAEPGARERLLGVARAPSNIADYRAFPMLLDALVLEPLTYTLRSKPPPRTEKSKCHS